MIKENRKAKNMEMWAEYSILKDVALLVFCVAIFRCEVDGFFINGGGTFCFQK